jgi:hypothetical protein
MTWWEAFHKAFLLQQDIEDLDEDCGVDHAFLELAGETDSLWVVKNTSANSEWLEIIWKPDATRMESIELPA